MITLPPFDFLSTKEIKDAIRTFGKRAQSRLKTLGKAFSEGGSMFGKKSYVLDKWGDFNTRTKGKSRKALENQLENALNILNAKSSTVKGIREIEQKRFETFNRHHFGEGAFSTIADKQTHNKGKYTDRDTYENAMKILGRIQKAEKELAYDSDEQVALAFQYAGASKEEIDKMIDSIYNKAFSSSAAFSELSLDEQMEYMTIGEDTPQEAGDEVNESAEFTDSVMNKPVKRKASAKKAKPTGSRTRKKK